MRPDSPRRYNKSTMVGPYLLLVEGPDEFEFFRFLRKRDDLQIHAYEGKNNLEIELRTIQAVEGFDGIETAIIVRDADNDPAAALQSTTAQWANAFKTDPPKVAAEQWFGDESGRQWAIWLMPDAENVGDLEELIWRAVPESPHKKCVDALIDCLSGCDPVPYSGLGTKARLYSWLATHKEPFKHLHAALNPRNNLFDPSDTVFAHHTALLDSL